VAVYLISYDLKEYSDEANERVRTVLKQMGAVRCLISEWLLEDESDSEHIGNKVLRAMDANDRILVVEVRDPAHRNLLNKPQSEEVLGRAG
jgi:hypothetical protein